MLPKFSQPTALWLSSFTLLALTASALPAQNETPPADGAEGVQLLFKHTVGQSQKFRGGGKADLNLTLGQGGLGPLPIGSKLDFVYTQKVAGTRTGTGTLSFQIDTLTMGVNALGADLTVKALNGKVTTTMNGGGLPPGFGGAGGGRTQASMLGQEQLTAPITLKRDPQGNVTLDPAKSQNQTLLGVLPIYLQLPAKPVAVGENWETTLKYKPVLGGGPSGGLSIPEIELASTHTLKAVEVKNGRRHAIITTVSTVAGIPAPAAPAAPAAPGAPPADAAGSPPAIQVDTTATTRFDIERGAIVSGQVKQLSSFNMGQIQLPEGAAGALGGGGAGAPAGAAGMRVDGEISYDFSEVPATAAKPAAKGKAKPKAKAKKR